MSEGAERVMASGLWPKNDNQFEAADAERTFYLPTGESAQGDEAKAFYRRALTNVWDAEKATKAETYKG